MLTPVTQVGQVPWIDQLWAKNPLVRYLTPEKSSPVVEFALARARERKVARESDKVGPEYNSRDFMSRFFDLQAKSASIPDDYVTAWATSNIQAGSDTTAIMMRAILYFLLKHPATLDKLMAELAQARREGRLSDVVMWKETRELPYLDACVKEASRLHPAGGMALERVVPEGGAVLCGKTIAAGTVVGINAWVAHRDQEVFGADADEWNPDRWLGDKDRRVAMERGILTVSRELPLPVLSALLTRGSSVWLRPPNLSWQEHLVPRDIQAHSNSLDAVRGKHHARSGPMRVSEGRMLTVG